MVLLVPKILSITLTININTKLNINSFINKLPFIKQNLKYITLSYNMQVLNQFLLITQILQFYKTKIK